MANRPLSGAPNRVDSFVFWAKVRTLRVLRSLANIQHSVPKLTVGAAQDFPFKAAESVTKLYTNPKPEERRLECGKVQNLRIAARMLDGLVIPAGQTFSFWRALGKPTRRRGFVPGRQVQEGCIIPSVGGGLCQLSNALFDVATSAGLEIIERHSHTMIVPGSAAELGKDATVAWNHIDLRFRSKSDVRLSVKLNQDSLVVSLHGQKSILGGFTPLLAEPGRGRTTANSCETCGQDDCFRVIHDRPVDIGTAWLLDSGTPEFQSYLRSHQASGDHFLVPISAPFPVPDRLQWNMSDRVDAASLVSVRRSLKLRKVASNGPERRRTLLAFDAELANAYAKSLSPFDQHLVVDISLLGPLYRLGVLGGRRVTVLASRWPLQEIHRRFDEAASRFPERSLLGDFRAPEELVQDEVDALNQCEGVVSPHAAIVSLFGDRGHLIPWIQPELEKTSGDKIVFAGPTIARKGCYEVREAARELGLTITTTGRYFEGDGFWDGINVEQGDAASIAKAKLVVSPTIMEDRPAALLRAVALEIPVITTPESGLPTGPLVTHIKFGNPDELIHAIRTRLDGDLSHLHR